MMRRLVVLVAMASAVAVSRPAAAQSPVTVSPGSLEGFARVGSSCPTLSWADEVDSAVGYELAVYRAEGADGLAGEPLLTVTLPAGARAWTPAADRCLPPGGRYGWRVRAVGAARPGEWSAPRLLEVPAARGAMELSRALEVVREHLRAAGPGLAREVAPWPFGEPPGPAAAGTQTGGEREAGSRAGEGPAPATPVGAPPTSTYGVVVGASGIGLLAVQLSPGGGNDLVLDGSSQGKADAMVTQSGLDRFSALPQVFSIGNSAGGGLTVLVDGHAVVTTATDRDTLAGLDCADGEIAKFNASQGLWECGAPP